MNAASARALLDRIRGRRVAVLGDLMLDRYVWGTAERISPEAPVPVVRVRRQTSTPGGAANVLRNLAGLGALPVALGVIGDDAAGLELRALLIAQGIDTTSLLGDSDVATIEKTRIVAGNQQVVRVDTEADWHIAESHVDLLVSAFEGLASSRQIEGLIIEDYAKGTVTQEAVDRIAAIAERHGVALSLDPHPANPLRMGRIAAATPNRAEAFALAGVYPARPISPATEDAPLHDVARRLRELWGVEHLLITLGADGLALFREGHEVLHRPTQAREVFDVSGAGDTVIASFTAALLAGATAEEACDFANHAAGIVVGKVGTATVTPAEIVDSFAGDARA